VPTALVYATGGLAYGDNKLTISSVCGNCNPSRDTTGTSDKVSAGWTVGGGLEYGFADHWSIKAEYLYYNLGSNRTPTVVYDYVGFAGGFASGSTSTLNATTNDRGNIARTGINYRF
jgi:outer membrane immunogenic protein